MKGFYLLGSDPEYWSKKSSTRPLIQTIFSKHWNVWIHNLLWFNQNCSLNCLGSKYCNFKWELPSNCLELDYCMPTEARTKSLWSVKSSWRWILKSLICWHHISNIWTRKVWGEKKVDRFILVDISLPIPELLQKKISVHSTFTLVG